MTKTASDLARGRSRVETPGVPGNKQFAEEAKTEATTTTLGAAELGVPETVFTKRYETLDEKIDAFKGELVKGVDALAEDEEWHEFLDMMGKFHNYSFSNQMLIRLQNPKASRVAGFKKWKEFERSVNKGEKGLSILAPKIINVTPKDGTAPIGADGKPIQDRRCVGFTTVSVFDVSQTDGKDLPNPQPNLTETPPDGFREDLEAAITESGYTVSYEDLGAGDMKGYTSGTSKKVVIDSNSSPASQAHTLAHELGHIKAGHIERQSEYHSGNGGCRGEMEVEAESIAYVLCRSNGMSTDISSNSSRYLNSWSAKGKTDADSLEANRKSITASGEAVAKTVKTLLAERPWRNVVS